MGLFARCVSSIGGGSPAHIPDAEARRAAESAAVVARLEVEVEELRAAACAMSRRKSSSASKVVIYAHAESPEDSSQSSLSLQLSNPLFQEEALAASSTSDAVVGPQPAEHEGGAKADADLRLEQNALQREREHTVRACVPRQRTRAWRAH